MEALLTSCSSDFKWYHIDLLKGGKGPVSSQPVVEMILLEKVS